MTPAHAVGPRVVPGPGGLTVPGNRWDLLAGRVPAEPPNIDVVIPYYDAGDPRAGRRLDLVLRALARQTHPAARTRVIVADDGSPVPPVVPGDVLVVRQEDRGFRAAAARNLGAARGHGDVVVFLDADTVPEPGFLAAITRLPALAAEAVVVGRRRYAHLTGPDADPGTPLPDPAWLADGYRATRDLLEADDGSFRYVLSCALACSRRFFEHLGGFDGEMVGYGGEDWEFGARAWHAGALLAHEPGAVAWHDGPDFGGRAVADPAGALAAKNAETLALAARVTGPGTRPAGVVAARPDLAVAVTPGSPDPDGAREVLTAAAVLAGADAVVSVPGPVPALFSADPRVVAHPLPGEAVAAARARIGIRAGVLPDPGALAEAVTRANRAGRRSVPLVVDGREAGRLWTRRGTARAESWGAPEVDGPPLTVPGTWVSQARLEAHFGGWGR